MRVRYDMNSELKAMESEVDDEGRFEELKATRPYGLAMTRYDDHLRHDTTTLNIGPQGCNCTFSSSGSESDVAIFDPETGCTLHRYFDIGRIAQMNL
jgi:hypothetical protein